VSELGIVILTGGGSTRLGIPKQGLIYQGKRFLENTIERAVSLNAVRQVVVTGAFGDQFNDLVPSNFDIVHNSNHLLGMSNSLKCGLQFLNHDSSINQVLVMLVDQPLISISHYQDLCSAMVKHDGIIATKFGALEKGKFGAPTIFPRKYFDEILHLSDERGAKTIIKKYIVKVHFVECDEALFDVDTHQDYDKLINRNK